MAVVIRPAEAGDHDALVAQFQALNVFEEAISGDRRTDRPGAIDSLAEAWRQVRETDGRALVAVRDGRVIGHLFLLFPEDAPFIRDQFRRFAYVSELFVREDARGGGVGSALLAEAERIAVARGVARMKIAVLVGNDAAASVYRRAGFVPYACDLVKPLGPGR
jgi:GNAT superfamily N-acetyltransferase